MGLMDLFKKKNKTFQDVSLTSADRILNDDFNQGSMFTGDAFVSPGRGEESVVVPDNLDPNFVWEEVNDVQDYTLRSADEILENARPHVEYAGDAIIDGREIISDAPICVIERETFEEPFEELFEESLEETEEVRRLR